MINNNTLICFDLETTSKNPYLAFPTQVAAMAINPRSLEPYPNGTFNSLICPEGDVSDWNVQQEALDITGRTIDDIKAAPPIKQVWKAFADFVKSFNPKGKPWTAPIACGTNIKGYDLIIVDRLCRQYKMIDKKENRVNLFYGTVQLDLQDFCFAWFENRPDPENYKMVTLRNWLGLPTKGSHEALKDVQDTWAILSKFLKMHRRLSPTIPFEGCFKR